MKQVKILRTFGNEFETLGVLSVDQFVCKTLELPDKNNANNISCFLPGKYLCKYTRSNTFSQKTGHDIWTYEIVGVPGRAGIRIHSANFVSQLRGCIALGNAHKDLNKDGILDVVHSGDTVAEFERIMEHKDFELEIIKVY